jgi:hypothetical protein
METGVKVAVQSTREQWKKLPCEHEYCRSCLRTWVETVVVDQSSTHVRCPCIGCHFVLYRDDIERLSGVSVVAVFDTLQQTDYTARLAEVSSDPDLLAWLDANTRACPNCSVVIDKSAGCDQMNCARCGHNFSWTAAPTPSVMLGRARSAAAAASSASLIRDGVEPISLRSRFWRWLRR